MSLLLVRNSQIYLGAFTPDSSWYFLSKVQEDFLWVKDPSAPHHFHFHSRDKAQRRLNKLAAHSPNSLYSRELTPYCW